MPKRTYKILRFDGGINNHADPRDIGDNQLMECTNIAVDSMGKMKILDDMQTIYKTWNASHQPAFSGVGQGFFAITTDRKGFINDSVAAQYPGQTYWLAEKAGGIVGYAEDGEYGTIVSSNLTDAVMYYVDGALRIGDSDHASASTTKWRGFVSARTFMPGTTYCVKTTINDWYTAEASINGAFPEFDYTGVTFAKNALCLNVDASSDSGAVAGKNGPGAEEAYGFDLETGTIPTVDADYDGSNDGVNEDSDLNWGFALEFNEDAAGNGTGTWMTNITTRYKFFITTMYDNHTQESLPQLCRMWDSFSSLSGLGSGTRQLHTEIGFRVPDPDADLTHEYSVYAENIALHFKPVFKILSAATGNYNFGSADVSEAGAVGNLRISGCRVYWASNEDGYTSLWRMFDAKWDEGIQVIGIDAGAGGSGGYSPWIDEPESADQGYATITLDAENKWTNPPRYLQYDVTNAHSATDIINVESFQTAVVANRRAYVGNITQGGWIHGDRMLKSPVDQFDKFPSVNNIDVAIHDGDDIILLLEYADRILQFKKNTLYIINVAGNSEYLEATHKHKGISNPGAACRTDYGIAWANNKGCFFYNGEEVSDLLEAEGMRKIKQETWAAYIGTQNLHRIGFNPTKRQLVIKPGQAGGSEGLGNEGFVYDMITKSWVRSSDFVPASTLGSGGNMINDPVDGALLWSDTTKIYKWEDGTVNHAEDIVVRTKDIDFGEPSIRKKVYRVRISYKGNASALQVGYSVNGAPTLNHQFNSDTTPLTDQSAATDWVHAELKPTTSSLANNIYSFQLHFIGPNAGNDFELNDISIIFRTKGIK